MLFFRHILKLKMLAVSIEFQLAFRQGRVSGEYCFKLLENDIELRLELQFGIKIIVYF